MSVQENAQAAKDRKAVMELLICPKCGQSNAAGERYCTNCGASLANVMTAGAGERKRGFFGKLFSKRH